MKILLPCLIKDSARSLLKWHKRSNSYVGNWPRRFGKNLLANKPIIVAYSGVAAYISGITLKLPEKMFGNVAR